MAHGGIAGPDGRKAYGLGSIFKSVTRPIKKVLSSDVGKLAALAGTMYLTGGGGMPQAWGGKGLGGFSLGNLPGAGFFGKGSLNPLMSGTMKQGTRQLAKSAFGNLVSSPWAWGAAAAATPFAMQAMGKWDQPTLDDLKLKAGKFGFNYEQMIRDIQNAETEEDYLAVLAQYNLSASDLPPWGSQKRAEGGRIGAQEGGLMDLGGMEKDYREDGGFVPIGGEEKADDVPARLSKNEFVFTADAVRAAGGGDIDQGAEVMENVMKNLERGGEISEESQGQGARDMFQVSERLSEVV